MEVDGANLAGAEVVYFGTTPGIIVDNNNTVIHVRSPQHDLDTVDVTVVTAGGTSTSPTPSADLFTYYASLTPADDATAEVKGTTAGAGSSSSGT